MDREIKFRAWDGQEMGIVHRLEWQDGKADNADVLVNDGTKSELFTSPILMQYTGITDKNDREIYEGDIVDYCMDGVCDGGACIGTKPKRGQITFNAVGWYFKGQYNSSLSTMCGFHGKAEGVRVIGNIFETPELTATLPPQPRPKPATPNDVKEI